MAGNVDCDWWVNSALGAGAQQPDTRTERPALQAALDNVEYQLNTHNNVIRGTALNTIVVAARKHLETLPKAQWRVTGTLPGGEPAVPYVTGRHEEALAFATDYLANGFSNVSVREWYGQ